MATADSVKTKIQGLINSANNTTGRNDKDMTSAVDALINGYSQNSESDYLLQSKTVSPSTSAQTVNPDSGYYGLSRVTVNAMPATTQATPSISVSSAGLITASATQTAGYVAAGTKSATKQLTVQAAKTVTPTESSQTAVSAGAYTTGAVTVGAIPSEYLVEEEINEQDNLLYRLQTLLSSKATPSSNADPVISVVRTVTVSADQTGANNTYTLLSGDEFIKEHYADEGFSALWYLASPVASATGVLHMGYQGNRNIGSTNTVRRGFGYRSTSASVLNTAGLTTAINGNGYSQHMRVNSNGDLQQYLASGYILKTGTYIIVLTCTT